jgi:hypothetical protein
MALLSKQIPIRFLIIKINQLIQKSSARHSLTGAGSAGKTLLLKDLYNQDPL